MKLLPITTIFYLLTTIIILIILIEINKNSVDSIDSINYRHHHRYQQKNRKNYVIVSLSEKNNQGPKLRGQLINEYKNITVAQFLGIRYAEKPQRFKRSKIYRNKWNNIRNALKWPPFCMQNNLKQFDYLTKIYNYNISEDCLYLNIWTPKINFNIDNENKTRIKHKQQKLLPVIIFIHGGSFNYMGISMEAYNGAIISSIGKIIFVTINYRLGLFGFFNNNYEDYNLQSNDNNNEDYYYKNLGLYDQITAIEWIRNNIHYFGGDKNQITLHGQSAGAISIGLLMTSPASQNLFKRVILQSASPMVLKQLFKINYYNDIIELANCTQNNNTLKFITDNNNFNDYNDDEYEYNDNDNDNDNDDDDLIDYDNNNNDDDDYNNPDDNTDDIERIKSETKCLENLSSKQLNEIQNKLLKKNILSFAPSIPSRLIPNFIDEPPPPPSPQQQFYNNPDNNANDDDDELIKQKDVLIGANFNESTLFIHHELPQLLPLNDQIKFNRTIMKKILKKIDSTDRLLHLSNIIINNLQNNNDEIVVMKEFFIFLSDFLFKAPVFKFAKFLNNNNNNNINDNISDINVYLYLFYEENRYYPKWIGSPHWNEMDYVFGLPIKYYYNNNKIEFNKKFTKKQKNLSYRMIRTWTYFAKYGKILKQQKIKWPKFDNKNLLHMNLLSNNISTSNDFGMKYFNLFDLLYDST